MARTLGGTEGRGYEIAQMAYDEAAAAENQSATFAERVNTCAFTLDDEELNETAGEYDSVARTWSLSGEVLEKLCQRNLPENDFYSELWEFISKSGLFDSDEERVSALFCMLANPRLPYTHFDTPEMPDEVFDKSRVKLEVKLRQLSQVARRSFPQRTQEAQAALDIINECETDDEKAVAMAMFLSYVRNSAQS